MYSRSFVNQRGQKLEEFQESGHPIQLNYQLSVLIIEWHIYGKSAIKLKKQNSQIIKPMTATKYQMQFNSLNSFCY